MKKINILLISQNYWPENFPINNISDHLSKNEFFINVLTGKPNYPKGKIYENYKYLNFKKDKYNEIIINRVPIFPRGKGKSINLIFNYLSFIISSILFGYFLLYKKKFDVILVYAPSPILQSLIGIFYSKIYRIKVVTWVQDLWPDVLYSTGHIKNKFLLKIVDRFVQYIYKKNDLLLVQSNEFKKIIEKKIKSPKIFYLPNPGNLNYLKPNRSFTNFNDQIVINDLKKSFSIVYGGNIGKVQSLDTIIKACNIIRQYKKIKVFVIGDGSEYKKLKKIVDNLKLNNLFLLGYMNENDLIKVISIANVLYLSLKKDSILNSTIPSKLQNYLASGKPIIASVSGEAKNIIKESECGLTCIPQNEKNLAETIIAISKLSDERLNEMGKNGLKFFIEHYHPNKINEKLANHIKNLIYETRN